MIHFSLFSGIGGFEIAAEAMGWKNFLSCDINEFGNRVREYYWPDAYHHKNIKDLNYETIHAELSKRFGSEWRSEDIILTGGFPCQPYSVAGKQLGTEDDRHLWPEMLRIISEVQPSWIVGENVRGFTNWNGGMVFDQVQADLEAQGYEVLPFLLPACAVGAPHRRDRIWIVAYSNGLRRSQEHELQRSELFKQSCKIRSSPIPRSERCDHGSDNREKRYVQGNEGSTEESESERQGRECGTGEIGSTTSGPNHGSRSRDAVQAGREEPEELYGLQRDVDDTNRTSEQREYFGQKREGQFNRSDSRVGFDYFQNFPTQSPICSGDDELPGKLDGITFPKWRNESIKAYGNAVVPALVLQIFKTIEKYNNS